LLLHRKLSANKNGEAGKVGEEKSDSGIVADYEVNYSLCQRMLKANFNLKNMLDNYLRLKYLHKMKLDRLQNAPSTHC
jgi:hypothetical protein